MVADVNFSIFIAIFIVKTDENCYDLVVFWHLPATVARKNVVSIVRCLVINF